MAAAWNKVLIKCHHCKTCPKSGSPTNNPLHGSRSTTIDAVIRLAMADHHITTLLFPYHTQQKTLI